MSPKYLNSYGLFHTVQRVETSDRRKSALLTVHVLMGFVLLLSQELIKCWLDVNVHIICVHTLKGRTPPMVKLYSILCCYKFSAILEII